MALINCEECGNKYSDTAKSCPKCGFRKKRERKGIDKGIRFVIGVVILFAIITAISVNPTFKYGSEAVSDGRSVIFIADRYLDGIIDKDEYRSQLSLYDKYANDPVAKGSGLYVQVSILKTSPTDADVLERRNELALMLHKGRR